MINGLYTAASSMVANRRELDITSNNISNVNTAGFKRDQGIKKSFPELLFNRMNNGKKVKELGNLSTGVSLENLYTDYSSGDIRKTGDPLDLAIRGEGYFVVQTPAGRSYTRNGNFSLNNRGQLVTTRGYPVLDSNDQPINIEQGSSVKVDGKGRIYFNNTEATEIKLQVVNFNEENQLTKMGSNLFTAEDNVDEIPAENYQILQAHLEGSNVNIVREMTGMIESNRQYEANQKAIQSIDDTLGKAVNDVGRLA